MHLVCCGLLLVICLGIAADDERIDINHEIHPIIPNLNSGTFNIHESEGLYGVGSSGGTNYNISNSTEYPWFLLACTLLSIVMLMSMVVVAIYVQARKDRRSPSNGLPARNVANLAYGQNILGPNIFKSGFWESRYFQDETWHGPYQLSLLFNPIRLILTGLGMDDVGKFTFAGTYSNETRQIDVKKEYSEYLDNRSENLDYPTTIQLMWNPQTDQFEGKWSVQTDEYNGEDLFDLKFKRSHPPVIHAEV
ncbi:unnamed protein product [Adineta steineri]|uniref:Uncharacterized protein n=2 Tax=Adineta steineri TaxID=433720 RepID=A0A814CA61_9BILA|nr:unnamed protein product [Adineta steineri]